MGGNRYWETSGMRRCLCTKYNVEMTDESERGGSERFEGLVAGERVCRTKIVWCVHEILLKRG